MDIRLQYAVTPDDFYEFQMAYIKHRASLTPRGQKGLRSPTIVLWSILVLILGGYCILSSVLAPPATPMPAPLPPPAGAPVSALKDLLISMIPALVVAILLLGTILWFRRSRFVYRRLASQATRIEQMRSAEITDTHIVIREHGAVTQMEWTYFLRFVETPSLFLLFSLPRMAHIVPKRSFATEEAVREFRAFAQAHIGNVPIGFPVQPPPVPRVPPVVSSTERS